MSDIKPNKQHPSSYPKSIGRRLSLRIRGVVVNKHGRISPKSSTPGKTKGINCQADANKKFFACNPHACRLYPREYFLREKKAGTKAYGMMKEN